MEKNDDEFQDDSKWKIIVFAIAIILFVAVLIYFFMFKDKQDAKDEQGINDGEEEISQKPEYDPSIPPTYLELKDVMDRVVKDVYGANFYDYMEEHEVVNIPDTQIYFESFEVSDSIDLMAVHLMSMKRNPYAFEETESTIRELPDGREIDLGAIKEEYSNLQYSVDRNNPSYVWIEGYSNGTWFEEEIDLSSVYEQYY